MKVNVLFVINEMNQRISCKSYAEEILTRFNKQTKLKYWL